jgi:trimeric autotransporter adhesin
VTNLGTITAAPGGYVALLGHTVSNQGAIHAPAGSVALAGGSAVTLSFDGNRLLDMRIDASTLNTLAENKQLIVADGGQVLMSAGAKDSLLASVVNNSGTIQARTVQNRAGKIVLLGGMEAGTTQVDGTLDASAPDGGDGGFVETSAAQVQVADGAKITTLAATGNAGTWLIDPHDFTIATSGGDITGTTLNNQLGSGNVTIESSQGANASGSGDIHVNDALTWSANTLTLTAAHDIDISAVMSAAGSAGLALNPATANGTDAMVARGTVNVLADQGGRVDFIGNSNTLKINNQPYTIVTALGTAGSTTGTDLQGIRGDLGGHYALGTNIDASATASWNGGLGFTPIGRSSVRFTGVFDGLGHTISGLTINRAVENLVGLFDNTGTGSAIRNLGLLGGSVTGNDYVGGLVGANYGGTISQAYATGVAYGRYYVGGLVGQSLGGGRISQAHATGAVGGWSSVGGLVGKIDSSSISQAYATGTVRGNSVAIGGLVGTSNAGSIGQSYATGTVTGDGNLVGGLVGDNRGTIIFAYATGAVSGADYVGGLVGNNNNGVIIQTYATGAVSGAASVGGLIGYSNRATSNSYWDTETTGQAASAGGTPLTTTALIAALPTGFDAGVWANSDNQATPYLLGMPGNQVFNKNDLPGTVTSASRPNLYTVILDLNQLQAVRTGLAGRYVLGNDIDASASIHWVDMEIDASGIPRWGRTGFAPIGNSGASFIGTFDGLGHTINGLTIDRPNTDYVGLFGATGTGSAIRNLGLLGGSVTGRKYVGGLAGDNGGTITGTYATGVVSGVTSVDGDYIGGLVGYNDAGGKLTGVYATGTVGGNDHVGGLVGDNLGTITNAYATGAVTGTFYLGGGDYVGGLVGYNDAGGTITNTYATGAVSGSNDVGGLVGLYGGGPIIDSYWDKQTTGQSISAGGGTGLTTAQMMDPASFAAWGTDISAVGGSSATWRIYAGDTAPLLRTFMTGLAVTTMNVGTFYNGTAFAGSSSLIFGTLTPGYWLPSSSMDASLILGDTNARTSTPATNAGSYALAGNLYSGQMGYDIDFTPGTLTIAPATLTYTATSASSIYGSTPSGLTGTVTGFVNGQTLASATTGTANFTTGATATSNVSSYAIDGRGLTANYGNYTFAQAASNATALTVNPATLTITANDASKTYGDTLTFAGNEFTTSGLQNGETISDVTLTSAGTAATASVTGGPYTITSNAATGGSFNAGNYTIAYKNGSLTVGQAALTVTANDDSKTYDGLAYTGGHGVTYSGFVNGETTSVLGGTLGYSGDSQGAINAGSYLLTPDGVTSGNYAITYDSGALLVNPAALVVTANGDSKTYDGLAYTGGHGVTYSGFVNGETASVLGGTLGYSGDSQGAINAGGYTITPDGLTGGNYAVTYEDGRLTVDQAALTVSSSNVSKIYDGGLSAIGTAVVSGGTLFGSDSLSGGNFAFTDKNAGTGKHVTVNGVSVSDGNSGGNYAVTYTDNTNSTINALSIIVDATGTDRVYDGSTADAVKLASTGLLLGDTVNFTGTGRFTDKNVGIAKAVGVSGIVATGADAGNYSFNTTANTTADISQLGITVDATGVDKVYDGSTAATIVALGSTGLVAGDVVTFDNASAAFDDKNAGTGKTVTVNGIAASGADANNYSFNTTANTAADISQLGITVDATGTNRVYDGTTADAVALASAGVLSGDTVSFTGTGRFTDKNVGVAKAVGVSGITGTGADANNYSFNTTANTTADISLLGIAVDATGANKIYDGGTADAVALASAGVLSGDTVSFTGTGSFADKNVGTGKMVAINGITASGADANNYSFNTTANTTADISQLGIAVDATGANKVYDGGTADAVTLASAGVLSGDTVNFTGAGSFADKNVGTGKIVTVNGIAASGADAGNYSFNTTANTTADISQLGVTVDATGTNRVYDGTTTDAVTLASTGLLVGDTVLFSGTGAFGDKNVGVAKAVGVSGIVATGADAGNYSFNTTANTTADISQLGITVDATGTSRVYDGTTADTVTLASAGVLSGDTVNFTGTGSFTDKNVGTAKAVGVSGVVASGADANNYSFNTTANTTADITALGITVDATGTNRVYDGTIADAVALASAGVLSGDTVNFTGTGSFANKNVGTAKAVGVSGIAASGADAGNYSYNTTAATTANITAKAITVDATGVDKVYDGSTAATIAALGTTGLVAGDVVTFGNASAVFDNKNAGTGKTVTVSGITASGADAANYSFNTATNATADISQLGITVNATGTNKVYDGSIDAAALLAGAGVISGDDIAFGGGASFVDKNVGTGKTVTVNGIAASGADAGNYSYNTTTNTTADISQLGITVDATGTNKIYDGTTADSVTLASAGVLSGDTVNFTGTGNFADKNVGTAKAVGVSGIAASGVDANNYSFNATATTTADITALGVTVDATGTNRVYDGTTADAVNLTSNGILTGDTVAFSGTGSFADKNVGTGKTVSVSGITASGADAGNYSFDTTATDTADITPLDITVDVAANDKVYDATTNATIALGSNGVLAGDVVHFDGTGSFADRNVGTGKTVTVNDIAASGADAGNYHYNASTGTTADITPATLTYLANSAFFQRGQTPDALSGTVTGLVGGDTLDEATDGTPAWQTPATATSPTGAYAIDGSGLSALNYVFVQAPGNATALRVIDGHAPRVVASAVAGLQQSSDGNDEARAPYAPDVRVINGGVRLP